MMTTVFKNKEKKNPHNFVFITIVVRLSRTSYVRSGPSMWSLLLWVHEMSRSPSWQGD